VDEEATTAWERWRGANVRRGGERSTSDFGHDQFPCPYHQN